MCYVLHKKNDNFDMDYVFKTYKSYLRGSGSNQETQ
jgi:hypothetical protein